MVTSCNFVTFVVKFLQIDSRDSRQGNLPTIFNYCFAL